MEKKLQGIALILFGIMVLLISTLAPWIRGIGVNYSDSGFVNKDREKSKLFL